jgi:hypothetical protein
MRESIISLIAHILLELVHDRRANTLDGREIM